MADDAGRDEGRAGMPVTERIAGVLGALAAAGIIGFIAWKGFTDPGTPPRIAVAVAGVEPFEGGHRVRFRAVNHGSEAGAQVTVRGRLMREGAEVEAAETVLDYVPGRSAREGGLFFARDPDGYVLELDAGGYAVP